MPTTRVGERIKLIRGDFQQEDFARQVGVHKNTVGRWERGERKPDTDDLSSILTTFPDISPAWLLVGEGEMRRGETGAGQTQSQTQSAVNTGGSVHRSGLHGRLIPGL